MSWKKAQDEAQRWLDKARLAELVKLGKPVDLRPYEHLLPPESNFRTMVLRAARRKLDKKNLTVYLPGE
ncbi:MAG: hypothetical protein LBK76_02540 [Verrucomicrobiales bacterium]|jgi:hypothetical protein|nr:hypothetical protein [Verrucomicrobiales bacterium]